MRFIADVREASIAYVKGFRGCHNQLRPQTGCGCPAIDVACFHQVLQREFVGCRVRF